MNRVPVFHRRHFFGKSATGIGTAALASLLDPQLTSPQAAETHSASEPFAKPGGGILRSHHHAPKAKRVIYLFMSGAPSQMDLFDYKPTMVDWYNKDLPESIRDGQRLTTMTSGQKRFPIAPSKFKFERYGRSGKWFSELVPHLASVADDWTVVKSVHTEAINHDPAITYIQTGGADSWATEYGRLGVLWLGKRKPGFANFCRSAFDVERKA